MWLKRPHVLAFATFLLPSWLPQWDLPLQSSLGTKIDAREAATQFCVVEIWIDLKYMSLAFGTKKAQRRRTRKHRVQTAQTN